MKSELLKMVERHNSWVAFDGASWCSIETRDKIIAELERMIVKEFCKI